VLLAGLLGSGCRSDEPQVDAAPSPPAAKVYVSDPKFKETLVDVFPGMDGPNLDLTAEDIRGRIVWNLWSGDGYRMWDYLAKNGFGTSDLLKTIDSRGRATRFKRLGVINQPGFARAAKPDEYGLFLDVPKEGDADGRIDEKIDAYTYGRSSGVVGLRIYRNPEFDAAAEAEWRKHIAADGVNHDYYEQPRYYNRKTLVRPYAVGMTCAFCHVSHDPLRPPANAEEPRWENLNDFVGAQYLKVWEVFGNGMGRDSFVWQLMHSNPPGTLDTSFVATDYLNNPATMNGVYSLLHRLERAEPEEITGGALALRHEKPRMNVPHVLKMGDDSVGLEAALSRVYVNIGEAWPEWSRHFRPLIGGPDAKGRQTPLDVDTLQRTSPHWNWSEERSPALQGYLVKVAQPLRLADAPGGAKYLTADRQLLDRGKIVFAENCAGCHSSKQPKGMQANSPEAKQWFRDQVVSDAAFFTENFLSDERRHPVTVIGTNATRSAATNAIRGHIWDNFSSETYKTLPAVGRFTVDNGPYGKTEIELPAGGMGYYRPPSLISLWSSAPYLHNNAVGDDFGDPSVAGRMRAFQEGIEKMLLIRPRGNKIWRTTAESWITIPQSYVPPIVAKMLLDPKLKDGQGNFRIGPIPEGTPINLLANTNLEGDERALLRLGLGLARALIEIDLRNMNEAQSTARLREVIPLLIAANKCPDLIEDKGHLFGTKLPLADKRALIELLKTF
jgi:mono/diheme cytochrome c family protein